MSQLVLTYPHTPGYKAPGTSQEAAQAIKPTAALLRTKVHAVFRQNPDGLTADEVAGIMCESVLSVRPRVTELQKMGLICDTGKRRKNASGMSARVMVAVSV